MGTEFLSLSAFPESLIGKKISLYSVTEIHFVFVTSSLLCSYCCWAPPCYCDVPGNAGVPSVAFVPTVAGVLAVAGVLSVAGVLAVACVLAVAGVLVVAGFTNMAPTRDD
jgi:hypothetical protein